MPSTFLCVLILRCEAPDEVAAWYREALDLPLKKGDHDYSCMLGQTRFAIHGLLEGESATSSSEVGIYVPHLDEFVEELKAKKIALTDPIQDYPWARAAQLEDPLGNRIYLMQLPKSSLKELGRSDL